MKFYLLSVVPILFSQIALGAPGNGVSLSRSLEMNALSRPLARRDTTHVSRDFLCGKGWREWWCHIQLNLHSPCVLTDVCNVFYCAENGYFCVRT